MTKIDQNLIRWSIGQGQQSCQKWKKSKKLLKSYRVDKNLRPAAAAYEPVQKHKVTPGILGWLNEMGTVSNCYESVLWLQSHMLPCNFGETPMFWNPVPGLEKVARRACARIPDVEGHDPMIWPAELSEWTYVSRTVWFVELAYCTCCNWVCASTAGCT